MLSKPAKVQKTTQKVVDGHPCNGDSCEIEDNVPILGGEFIVSICRNCLITFNRQGTKKVIKEKKEKKQKSKRRKKPKKVKPDNLFTGHEGCL